MWHVSYFNVYNSRIYHQYFDTMCEARDFMDWAENHNFLGIMVKFIK